MVKPEVKIYIISASNPNDTVGTEGAQTLNTLVEAAAPKPTNIAEELNSKQEKLAGKEAAMALASEIRMAKTNSRVEPQDDPPLEDAP